MPATAEIVVMCDPYEGEPHVVSRSSFRAVFRDARRAQLAFRRANPNGYGYRYYPAAQWRGVQWQEIMEETQ